MQTPGTPSEPTEIGLFSRVHGLKGQLIFQANIPGQWDELKLFFIKDRIFGFQPFRLIAIRPNAKSADGLSFFVQVEGINDRAAAEKLQAKRVFVHSELAESLSFDEEEPPLIGYALLNQQQQLLGEVVDVLSNGDHELLLVQTQGSSSFWLPCVNQFIVTIDDHAQQIEVDQEAIAPLIDLND